jgi:hypothetical protein
MTKTKWYLWVFQGLKVLRIGPFETSEAAAEYVEEKFNDNVEWVVNNQDSFEEA